MGAQLGRQHAHSSARAQTVVPVNRRRVALVTPSAVLITSLKAPSISGRTLSGPALLRVRELARRDLQPSFMAAPRPPVQMQTEHRSTAVRWAKLRLLTEQRRRQELRFYRNRPRLRLPATEVTRQRRRHGGLGLFARNTLKRPQTRGGLKRLLLPPRAHTALFLRTELGGLFSSEAVHVPEQHDSDDAQV